MSSVWALLSSVRRTMAKPMAPRRRVPPKMTSSILPAARSWRELVSPSTHRTASDRFDLPEPVGADDAGDALVEPYPDLVRKALEALDLQFLEHHFTFP